MEFTAAEREQLADDKDVIAATRGSDGLRDEGMLDSALSAPFQTFGGEDVYPSLQQKATRLCFGLIKNHPFVDGNKRIGAHAMRCSSL